MDRDKRAELLEHLNACHSRLKEATNPHDRDIIHSIIEQLEAQLAALERAGCGGHSTDQPPCAYRENGR
jgi:hypothetical protein